MNQALHDWLIENFGGYDFQSGTSMTRSGKVVRVAGYDIEIDFDTTPGDFIRKMKEEKLTRTRRKLADAKNRLPLLQKEIAKLEQELSVTEWAPNLRYSLNSAYDAGVNEHPQKMMKALGIHYEEAEPQPLGDCWWFFKCTNVPEPLPVYLTVMHVD